MPEVSLEMLQALLKRSLEGQAMTHRKVDDALTLIAGLSEQGRRLERRISDVERRIDALRDDIQVMLKAELMGRLGHFETRIEARLEAIEARLPQ